MQRVAELRHGVAEASSSVRETHERCPVCPYFTGSVAEFAFHIHEMDHARLYPIAEEDFLGVYALFDRHITYLHHYYDLRALTHV